MTKEERIAKLQAAIDALQADLDAAKDAEEDEAIELIENLESLMMDCL